METGKFIDAWQDRAAALIADFEVGAPPYDVLPASMMDADFLPAAQLNIELFFRFLRTGDEPGETDTEPLVARAVSLVRDGMPLAEALTNYRVGLGFVWNQVVGTPTAAESVTAADAAFRLAQYVALMTGRIADACVDDVRQSRYDRIEQHRAIAEALLTGGDPYEWAEDAAVTIVDAYVVAVIRLGDAPPGILTALRRRLAGITGGFLYRDSGGWTTLLPLRSAGDESAAIDRLAEILQPKTRSTKPALWVGVSAAATRDLLPAAFAEARVLAESGRSLRRAGMICRREDMVFEYAIATSSAAANLVRVLDPLDSQPVLGETLEVFILQDFNQNGTARELSVHRNTITYRLTRIAELTGYDPQTPAGISTLMGARVARQLLEKGHGTSLRDRTADEQVDDGLREALDALARVDLRVADRQAAEHFGDGQQGVGQQAGIHCGPARIGDQTHPDQGLGLIEDARPGAADGLAVCVGSIARTRQQQPPAGRIAQRHIDERADGGGCDDDRIRAQQVGGQGFGDLVEGAFALAFQQGDDQLGAGLEDGVQHRFADARLGGHGLHAQLVEFGLLEHREGGIEQLGAPLFRGQARRIAPPRTVCRGFAHCRSTFTGPILSSRFPRSRHCRN
ncbi:hypothetical protein GL305_17495 [Nocardia seriolae]|nr:hypothetical protein [Nocardia seriolae]MTJ74838.1 hypothetical protein [Nocardia seriolae]MTJ87717.1 hypothetical protein [Nocardia seriolae]MTK31710.1 hypothetical protein [Nocardia seriolae]MTK40613.1 hypothetical protein [Nocardia seriolae]